MSWKFAMSGKVLLLAIGVVIQCPQQVFAVDAPDIGNTLPAFSLASNVSVAAETRGNSIEAQRQELMVAFDKTADKDNAKVLGLDQDVNSSLAAAKMLIDKKEDSKALRILVALMKKGIASQELEDIYDYSKDTQAKEMLDLYSIFADNSFSLDVRVMALLMKFRKPDHDFDYLFLEDMLRKMRLESKSNLVPCLEFKRQKRVLRKYLKYLKKSRGFSRDVQNMLSFEPLGFFYGAATVEYEHMVTRDLAFAAGLKFNLPFAEIFDDEKLKGRPANLGALISFRYYPLSNYYAPRGLWIGPTVELINEHFDDFDASIRYLHVLGEIGWRFWITGDKKGFALSPYVGVGHSWGIGDPNLLNKKTDVTLNTYSDTTVVMGLQFCLGF